MTDIPRRPEPRLPENGLGHDWLTYYAESAVHEHAVARVAVEAIKENIKECWGIPLGAPCLSCDALRETLALIEASGWEAKP